MSLIKSTLLLSLQRAKDDGAVFTDKEGLSTRLVILAGDWKEMGSPDEITVTIEPGDTLNGERPKGAL